MPMTNLQSRAVIGEYVRRLSQDVGGGWIPLVANEFRSDQPSEDYAFLGAVPTMREWKGERKVKELRDDKFTIVNSHFESTIEFKKKDMRRDKTGQIDLRIAEHVQRAQSHMASLLSTLILNGKTNTCYDGQFFFDTDHPNNGTAGGTQSNKINADISSYPVSNTGTTTLPSPEEANYAINEAINQIASFVDDQGEPMNEDAQNFVVMCPLSLASSLRTGVTNPRGTGLAEFDSYQGNNIQVIANQRLSSWTSEFIVMRSDAAIKSLIIQRETDINIAALAEGSDFEFHNDAWQFGLDYWCNVGYGYWQDACHVTLV